MKNELNKVAAHLSPFRLLIVLSAVMFVTEAAIMFVVHYYAVPPVVETFVEISIHVAVLFSLFYFLVFKPLNFYIKMLETAGESLGDSEERLRESNDTIKTILDSLTDAMLLIGTDGNIIEVNETVSMKIDKTRDKLIGTCIYDYLPPALAKTRKAFIDEVVRSGKAVRFEDKRNDEFVDNSIYPVFDEKGRVAKVVIYGRYITERKLMENDLKLAYNLLKEAQDASLNIMEDLETERGRLKALADEREVLLKEIHHRVKNNMQVMASLLRLQEKSVKDDHILELMKDAESRISVMAMIHEKLYLSKDLAKIGLRDYIKDLADSLIESFGSGRRITIKQDVEALAIEIDRAIPIGMIINELVTNSIKYAFPEGREGEISIALRRSPDNEAELIVGDNGIGLPDDFDIKNAKGLGMQLVSALAENQLQGKLDVKRDNGTEFRIRFKI